MLTTERLSMRWMILADLPGVLPIEEASFECPWQEDDFRCALRWHSNIGVVAMFDGLVVGYVVYQMGKQSIKVLNLAVDPDFRHWGIGRALLSRVKVRLRPTKRRRMTLRVRETNLGAQLWLRACGVEATKVIRNGAEDGEDAYLFVYKV